MDIRVASFNGDINGYFWSLSGGRRSQEGEKLRKLFGKLRRALREENYLEAARIRDEINELKGKLQKESVKEVSSC